MATKKHKGKDAEIVIEAAIDKTENFLYKNGKTLLIALSVMVLIVGGYFAYKYLYAQPRADKASSMMFMAQQHFGNDEFDKALNGDGVNPGFLDIVARFGSSPEANLAHHYAGISFLRLGDLDNALSHFRKFSPTSGVPNVIINARNFGLMGDVYSQQGDFARSAVEYRKAVDAADNTLTTPQYLRKLGLVLVELGKPAEAIEAMQRIKDYYPESMEARDIDKLIGQFEQKK